MDSTSNENSPYKDLPIPEVYLRFPRTVGLELSSKCPLACVMCPQPDLQRPNREIRTELALKVIEELEGFPDTLLEPQGMGELFIHPEWPRILRHAVERKVQVLVLTHGAFLTDAVIEELMDIGPGHIMVGIEGVTKAVHESVARRSNFEQVVRSVKQLLATRKERGLSRPHVHLRMTPSKLNHHEGSSFLETWRPLLGEEDTVQVNPVCNTWTGKLPYLGVDPDVPNPTSPRFPCPQLWMTTNVLEDGRVSPCCLDCEGEIEIGNVQDNTLEEIWHGERLSAYRQAHLEGRFDDVPLCGDCPDWPNYVRSVLGNDWGRPQSGSEQP
jgi:radical SAM protein with 4Fe4S-binding SPASM domain